MGKMVLAPPSYSSDAAAASSLCACVRASGSPAAQAGAAQHGASGQWRLWLWPLMLWEASFVVGV